MGKQQLICEEMDEMDVSILGMSETYLEQIKYNLRPTIRHKRTYTIHTAGKNKNGHRGVGFLIDSRLDITDYHIESPDVMGIVIGNKCIIQIYAPDGEGKQSD